MDVAPTRSVPPRAVLAAFGLHTAPVPLAGGQDTSWRAGEAVLKPLGLDSSLIEWQGSLLARLEGRDDFRVSVPMRTAEGRWKTDGWTAWTYQPGTHASGRWQDIISAGERLHAALAAEPEPVFPSTSCAR